MICTAPPPFALDASNVCLPLKSYIIQKTPWKKMTDQTVSLAKFDHQKGCALEIALSIAVCADMTVRSTTGTAFLLHFHVVGRITLHLCAVYRNSLPEPEPAWLPSSSCHHEKRRYPILKTRPCEFSVHIESFHLCAFFLSCILSGKA